MSTFVLLTTLTALAAPQADSRPAVAFFEKNIRPVLVESCQRCHGAKKQQAGLRLDSRQAILKGGNTGPAVVPGNPAKSLLLKAIRHEGEVKMPAKKLPQATIDNFTAWVKAGAVWPQEKGPIDTPSSVAVARKNHWAFKAVANPTPPAVKNASWAQSPIDHFILAALEKKSLTPAPRADRRTLIRRLHLDLTGLPPTPDEVQSFLDDKRPGAYERLVDRLLASPAYGERWGRHWLDVARYADTKGYVFLEERRYPYSYTYRDYVVKALNDDLPYDQFLIHQLAADRLKLDDPAPLAAMGFLTLGRRFLNNIHDIIDDRIDVTMRGLQGMTVACARCHDHKFDPIPARDYYSLYGVFAGSFEPKELPLLIKRDPTKGPTKFEKEMAIRQGRVNAYLEQQRKALLPMFRAKAGDYLLATASPGRSRDLRQPLVMRWRQVLTQQGRTHAAVLMPWQAFVRLPANEFATKAPGIAATITKNQNKRINPLVAAAFAGKAPASLAEVAKKYGELFTKADKERASKTASPALVAIRNFLDAVTNIPAAEMERYLDRAQRNKLRGLQKSVEQWRVQNAGAMPRGMVLQEGAPFNPVVFLRGNPGNRGVSVPRQFLEVVAGEKRKPFANGSGRLDFAKAIASKDNPLTARVMVNRLWMHHFGQGIVRTPGDFGLRGDKPTHPELLDWLATRFMDSGWSVKHVHRLILLSSVYQQQSQNEDAEKADPDNLLLARMNRRRLEFEALRDSLLAVSGSLDRRMGGPAVDITKAPFPPRRSLYGFIDRQNLPGLFRTFDLASPDTSTPQRHSTTVPQQALFLMNGPFVHGLAKSLLARPEVVDVKSDRDRIDRLHRLAYGRPADKEEIDLGLAFIQSASSKTGGLTAWEQYGQVLLLANEFAFID